MVSLARRRIRRPLSPNRKFVWARHFLTTTHVGAAVGSDLLFQFEQDYGAQLIGATITRIRGYMFAASTSTGGTVNAFRFGARVLSGQLDLSSTVPDQDPWVDENADWMLWEPFPSVFVPGTGSGDQLRARMVDVKSQRRLDELGEKLVMFYSGSPGAPANEFVVGWDLSIGVKLP